MRSIRKSILFLLLGVSFVFGCASTRQSFNDLSARLSAPRQNNPIFVPTTNHRALWDAVEDIVDDYYPIAMCEPVRLHNNVFSEGRLDTMPIMGASILEPWHGDSMTYYDRWERTLQTIRTRAMVRVTPDEGGFWLQVFVYKELENLPAPMNSNISIHDVRYDSANSERVGQNRGYGDEYGGWILIDRDNELEQHILQQILCRLNVAPMVIKPAYTEAEF